MKELTKFYSRERSLFYLNLWYECDLYGMERYLGIKMSDGVFIMRPDGRSEVWYNEEDSLKLTELAIETLRDDAELARQVIENLYSAWEKVRPYFTGGKKLQTVQDAEEYYQTLVEFWVGWNSIFFELPDHERAPQEFSQKMLALRPQTEKYSNQMNQLFSLFVKEKFPDLGPYAHAMMASELRSFTQDTATAKRVLEKRVKEGSFLFQGQVHCMSELENVLERADICLKTNKGKQVNELAGTAAHKGKVQGRVRIAFTQEDMKLFQPGEILVTEMTNPDYVHVMKQAGAIVTNEGGMLCHAAIVSRELKKPCIIGTKIATEVFKDGDMVEVDADNGIIRLLN